MNSDWLTVYRQRQQAMLAARARDAGVDVDVEEYRARAEARIRDWVNGASVRIRVREPALVCFLSTRTYKRMVETGTSGGQLQSVNTRIEVEDQILGIAPDAPAASRPISGYLEGSDESGAISRTYGPIVLEAASDLRESAWFLLGDLVDTPRLGGGQILIPCPLLAPSVEAASGRTNILGATTLADACPPHRYAEVLIFGGLPAAQVVKVTYTQGEAPSRQARELITELGWTLDHTEGHWP